MRCVSKMCVVVGLVVLVLGFSSVVMATPIIVGQLSDLSSGWVGRTNLATGINDSQGNPQWAVGWRDAGEAFSAGMAYTMKGWGWKDDGTTDLNQTVPLTSPLRDPVAKGYSWNGTHDTGWADYVGFQAIGTRVDARSNADLDEGTGSTVILQYTVLTAGTYSFDFLVDATSFNKMFGIYSVADGAWLGTSTYNPDTGTATVNSIGVSFDDSAVAGDKYLIAWKASKGQHLYVGNTGTISHGTIGLIPEPGTLALLATGLLGLLCYAWRKRK